MAAPYRTITADLLEQDTVVRLVLNRPTGNVLTTEMMRELADALRAHRDDRHLRFVFLRGAGGHFSYGASIDEHRRDRVAEMLATFHDFVRDLAAFPVPVAALVEGRCLGGGFEVALCCHLVFAAEDARFACPEIKLGVFPPVLAAAGPWRLPGAMAERLLLTGEEFDAATAERLGFASVLPARDPEQGLLNWYRTTLAPLSAFALRQAVAASRRRSGLLRALHDDLPAIERQYLEEVAASQDGNEGIDAFLARRPPKWEDA